MRGRRGKSGQHKCMALLSHSINLLWGSVQQPSVVAAVRLASRRGSRHGGAEPAPARARRIVDGPKSAVDHDRVAGRRSLTGCLALCKCRVREILRTARDHRAAVANEAVRCFVPHPLQEPGGELLMLRQVACVLAFVEGHVCDARGTWKWEAARQQRACRLLARLQARVPHDPRAGRRLLATLHAIQEGGVWERCVIRERRGRLQEAASACLRVAPDARQLGPAPCDVLPQPRAGVEVHHAAICARLPWAARRACARVVG
mmetsp:Transcript_41705/g.108005  ORF Transcript_41705/g.108005 Transcript_41705/m.108005 type:complete len:261 (-) Transcript_41705:1267-2049(-)